MNTLMETLLSIKADAKLAHEKAVLTEQLAREHYRSFCLPINSMEKQRAYMVYYEAKNATSKAMIAYEAIKCAINVEKAVLQKKMYQHDSKSISYNNRNQFVVTDVIDNKYKVVITDREKIFQSPDAFYCSCFRPDCVHIRTAMKMLEEF